MAAPGAAADAAQTAQEQDRRRGRRRSCRSGRCLLPGAGRVPGHHLRSAPRRVRRRHDRRRHPPLPDAASHPAARHRHHRQHGGGDHLQHADRQGHFPRRTEAEVRRRLPRPRRPPLQADGGRRGRQGVQGIPQGGYRFPPRGLHGAPDRHGEESLRGRRRQHRHRLRAGGTARRGRRIDPPLPPLAQGDAGRRLGSGRRRRRRGQVRIPGPPDQDPRG